MRNLKEKFTAMVIMNLGHLCSLPEEGVAHPLPQQALPERGARLVQGGEEVETGAAAREPAGLVRHLRILRGDC